MGTSPWINVLVVIDYVILLNYIATICLITSYCFGHIVLFAVCYHRTKVLFLAPSVCSFLFVYEICREPLNGFAQNSHGRRVWSLVRTTLKVKIKGQDHQG